MAVLTAVSRCGSFLLCRQAKIGGARADVELSAPVVVACNSHSSNIVDVLSDYWTRPGPSSTTHATPSQTLLTTSRCTSSLLRTSLHNTTGLFTKSKADVSEFTTSLDAEKADLVEAEKRLSASVESQAASKTVASKWLPSTRLP